MFRPLGGKQQVREARLSDKAVARIIKRGLEACGRDSSEYSGHSQRAGFATAAAMGRSGAPDYDADGASQFGEFAAVYPGRESFLHNVGSYTGL